MRVAVAPGQAWPQAKPRRVSGKRQKGEDRGRLGLHPRGEEARDSPQGPPPTGAWRGPTHITAKGDPLTGRVPGGRGCSLGVRQEKQEQEEDRGRGLSRPSARAGQRGGHEVGVPRGCEA